METIVIVSGYFDPIHKGHIEYFKKASELGRVICILNTDEQAVMKKGRSFMDYEGREKIINSIKYVDLVVRCVDDDYSVCKTLSLLKLSFHKHRLIFAKGGDRTSKNIPEYRTCRELKIEVVDNLGRKIEASSNLIQKCRS